MPRSQTPTPTQRAQAAVDKADAALTKKREKLAKLAARAEKARGVFESAKAEHATLQSEIAYDQRHRDLLASHPLLTNGEIPGQTSIDDFPSAAEPAALEEQAPEVEEPQEAQPAVVEEDVFAEPPAEARRPGGITVRENVNRPAGKRLFAAAPTSDEEGVTPVPQEDDGDDVFQVPAQDEKQDDDNPPFML